MYLTRLLYSDYFILVYGSYRGRNKSEEIIKALIALLCRGAISVFVCFLVCFWGWSTFPSIKQFLGDPESIYKSITLQLEIFSCSLLQDNFRTWALSVFSCLHCIMQLDAPTLHQYSYVIVSGYPNTRRWTYILNSSVSLSLTSLALAFFALFLRAMLHKQWILRTGNWGMVKELLSLYIYIYIHTHIYIFHVFLLIGG